MLIILLTRVFEHIGWPSLNHFVFNIADGEPKSKSTEIDWKPDMDLMEIASPSRFFAWFLQRSDAANDKVLKVKVYISLHVICFICPW